MSSQGASGATPTIGAVVVAPDGARIGEVVAVALDAGTVRPDWLVIDVDGKGRTALPAYVASLTASGELAVPFARELVQRAPSTDRPVLDEAAASAVLAHYGLGG